MRRRHNRRRGNNSVRNIVIACFVMTLLFGVGYGAFQTVVGINAKGTIKMRTNFYVSSSGNDDTGNGSQNKPYATIQKAYDSAPATATIYIVDNITQTEHIKFITNKEITLKSLSSNNISVIEASGKQLQVSNSKITFENIKMNFSQIFPDNSTLTIKNSSVIGDSTGYQSTLWLWNSNNNVYIYDSYIYGPYAIGGHGGSIYIENSKLEAVVEAAICVNEGYCGNITIVGKSELIGTSYGIKIHNSSTCSSSLTMNKKNNDFPYIRGNNTKGIDISNANTTFNFNYGDVYGKSGIYNAGTNNYRNNTIFKEDESVINGTTYIHSYLMDK